MIETTELIKSQETEFRGGKSCARILPISMSTDLNVSKHTTTITAACHAIQVRSRLPKSKTVTEAIYDSGFNSNGRFDSTSKKLLGMTSQSCRNHGKDEVIRFAIGECSLGSILVASSLKGVCCITLGDAPELLLVDLQHRFHNAKIIGGDGSFEKLIALVVGFVEAPQLGLDLPLDIRGTAFQQRVWQALRKIPSGSTASYSDIARMIGSPKSVRAVAGACAANSISLAIPCHRIVRSDGHLSGYRWGIERKRSLLAREASA